jgi:molybdate transport system ATP-binding protein
MLDARILKKLGNGNGHALTIDVHLKIDDGITVLFGSSGAGKTSILRAIAGIITPDQGKITAGAAIYFDSATSTNLSMQKRNAGYVFQHHALFPHMTAEKNALYGVRNNFSKAAQNRVRELFSMLGVEKTAERYPHELSGGEQQRIALARALATDPAIMLLDEPLSAVDVATRTRLLEEIAVIQQRTGIPFLYVTHNHTEALRLGKTMIVMDEGKIVQEGAPMEIFNAPQTSVIARVVGAENILEGRIRHHQPEDGMTAVETGACTIEIPYNGLEIGSRITLGIRSDDILVARERITQTSARNVLKGEIRNIFRDIDKAELQVFCGIDFKVSVTPATVRILNLEIGSPVYLLIKARAIHMLAYLSSFFVSTLAALLSSVITEAITDSLD